MPTSFSTELKFLVDLDTAQALRAWARAQLEPDPNGGGAAGDEYRTTSLYFDTGQFDTFHRRSSYGRAKYRIRRYGDASEAFLERKLKRSGFLCKRRTVVPLSDIEQAAARYGLAGRWFQRRLALRQLHPVCEITYRRIARTGMAGGGPVRVTIDADLSARPVTELRFTMAPGTAVLATQAVVEMKFHEAPPALLRRAIQDFRLDVSTISKYRLSVDALRLAAADAGAVMRPLHA